MWVFECANVGALTGELALVPATDSVCPPMTTWKPSPCAATSGYARPVVLIRIHVSSPLWPRFVVTYLKRPALVVPSRFRNAVTADDW